jgi:hypothetical protein
LDFYCSGGEGEITDRVAQAMAALGWRGVGHGAPLRRVDFSSGTVEVLSEDGEWVVERRGVEGDVDRMSDPSGRQPEAD